MRCWEYYASNYPDDLFRIHLHTHPIGRAIEFLLGMFFCALYKCLTINPNKHFSAISHLNWYKGTLLELFAFLLVIFVIWNRKSSWYYAFYAPFWGLLITILALNKGLISNILSSTLFQLFSKIQLEFYLFHQVVIRMVRLIFPELVNSIYILFATDLLITVLLCIVFKRIKQYTHTMINKHIITN